jgi:serine protease AprX
MKKTLLLLISAFFITSVLIAQSAENKTYVVYFSDKGTNMDAAVNPSLYLSDKAIERRIKQNIPFDMSDIPVNEEYVKSVSKTGAKILTRSRWFNNLVIEASPEMMEEILRIPAISKISLLDNGTFKSTVSVKPFFEPEKINPQTNNIPKKATNDIYNYGNAYNQINQLNGQFLHNNGFSGQGMTIAVLDAGFNSVDVMTCFDSLRANNQIKGTRDFAQPGNNVYATTMHSHGTSVLSCMGAYVNGQMVGTAPKADYWLIRTEVGEYEKIIEEYFWVSGAEFADSIGADLINSSLGYTEFDDALTNHTYADMDGNTTFITNGADKAAEKGILVVNSAGNSGGPFDSWKYIGAPADGDSVFSIGAVTAFGTRASFSSLGPTYDRRIKPTVSGQGENSSVYSPWGLGNGSGTSFSSPIICGMTACYWQAFPQLSNMEVIEAIKAASSQASEPDSLLGWGIPNYELAYTSLSVFDKSQTQNLTIYPNPVNDKLTIGFPTSITGKYTLEIINLQGKIVYSFNGTESSVRSLQVNDISYLPVGIYLVKVTNGAFIFSGKIIKK